MAFDMKRLRTFDWLHDLAHNKAAYSSKFPKFGGNILVYCGSVYATNEIVLAKVDYPEFEHLSDYEWSNVVEYETYDGKLLDMPILEVREKQFSDNRIFDKFFDEKFAYMLGSIDSRVYVDVIKPFKINKISPVVYTSENKLFLMGHNKDVSIRVAAMCMKGVR